MTKEFIDPNDSQKAASAIGLLFGEHDDAGNQKTQQQIDAEKAEKEKAEKDKNNGAGGSGDGGGNNAAKGLFSDDDDDNGGAGENQFSTLASDFGLELSDEEKEAKQEWSYELVKSKLESHIEQQKKKLDLEEYDPEARSVIQFFTEKKGTFADFYKNSEIIEVERHKGMTDQELWIKNTINQYMKIGFTETEASQKAESDLSSFGERKDSVLKNFGIEMRKSLDAYQRELFQNIIDEKNKFIETQNQQKIKKAEAEKNAMVGELKKITHFMGINISEKDTKFLQKEIESGKFFEKISKNPARAQLFTYLSLMLEPKIVSIYESAIKNTGNENYDKGMIKFLSENFNAQNGSQGPTGFKGTGDQGFKKDDPNSVNNYLNSLFNH